MKGVNIIGKQPKTEEISTEFVTVGNYTLSMWITQETFHTSVDKS
jgi:hypothetical protein